MVYLNAGSCDSVTWLNNEYKSKYFTLAFSCGIVSKDEGLFKDHLLYMIVSKDESLFKDHLLTIYILIVTNETIG